MTCMSADVAAGMTQSSGILDNLLLFGSIACNSLLRDDNQLLRPIQVLADLYGSRDLPIKPHIIVALVLHKLLDQARHLKLCNLNASWQPPILAAVVIEASAIWAVQGDAVRSYYVRLPKSRCKSDSYPKP